MENKIQRESNFELLRIVSMLLLIAHHFCVHSGILNTNSPNKIISLLFLPVGKICFVAFIAISMWFLVDKSFKASRWLKTWLEVFFYSVIFCFVSLIINKPNSFLGFVHSLGSSFFPIAGNSHGFASSYLLFYLLYPFISKLMSITNKNQHIFLLGIVFYAQIFEQMLNKITFYSQPIFSELLLFVFCYLLMFCLKKYPIKITKNLFFLISVILLVYLYVFLVNYIEYFGTVNNFFRFLKSFVIDESSILYILAGFSLFFIFKIIRIKNNCFINKLASCTFGVLLIHDHNYFRYLLWNKVLKVQDFFNISRVNFILYYFGITISIFIICSLIDLLRQILEGYLVHTKTFKILEDKLNYIN